jgi:hypothetical protein
MPTADIKAFDGCFGQLFARRGAGKQLPTINCFELCRLAHSITRENYVHARTCARVYVTTGRASPRHPVRLVTTAVDDPTGSFALAEIT